MTTMDLASILIERATLTPHRLIYSFLDKNGAQQNVTYEELAASAQTLATALKELTREDEIILLSLKPSLSFIELVFGCILAGRTFMPTYPLLSQHDAARIEALINKIPVSLIVSDASLENKIQTTAQTITVSELNQQAMRAHLSSFTDRQPSRPIFLQPSSGTTRLPKPIIVDNQALMACLGNMHHTLATSTADIGCSWLPPYHDMGLIGALFLPLYADFPVYLLKPSTFIIDPMSWIQTLSTVRATITAAPNIAYALCSARYDQNKHVDLDLSHLRVAINSAEMVRAKTLTRFYETYKPHGLQWQSLVPAYGLAEATLMVNSSDLNQGPLIRCFKQSSLWQGHAETCSAAEVDKVELVASGKPVRNMENLIVDRDTFMPKQPFEIGEIWIKGNSLTKGYYNDNKLNELAYMVLDSDIETTKYFRTGDSGFIDDKGNLFVTGRIKDVIKTPQGQVAAEEIEELVDTTVRSDPLYASAALILNSQDKSELIILKEAAADTDFPQTATNIHNKLRQNLGIFSDSIIFLPQGQIPRTTSGKIKRHAAIVLFKYDLFEPLAAHSFSPPLPS